MERAATVGLFGKTPSARDFVRVNIGAPAVRAFDAWLRESVMTLPSLRAHLPHAPLPFVFRAPDAAGWLIGVMRASADGVGREFPLAVFHQLDARAHAGDWSALPSAYAGFLAAAAALLDDVDGTPVAALPERLAGLPLPEPAAAVAWVERRWAELAQVSADELLDRLFARPAGNPEGERCDGDHLHGLGMLLRACERVASRPPDAVGMTLDCPICSELELWFWLELARARLAWSAPPSLLWSPSDYRLLLALGSPGPTLLGVLGTPGTFDDAIWAVTTDDEQLAGRGERLLSGAQREAIERPGQTGAELLRALSTAACASEGR